LAGVSVTGMPDVGVVGVVGDAGAVGGGVAEGSGAGTGAATEADGDAGGVAADTEADTAEADAEVAGLGAAPAALIVNQSVKRWW
jgi:hypothetical protein